MNTKQIMNQCAKQVLTPLVVAVFMLGGILFAPCSSQATTVHLNIGGGHGGRSTRRPGTVHLNLGGGHGGRSTRMPNPPPKKDEHHAVLAETQRQDVVVSGVSKHITLQADELPAAVRMKGWRCNVGEYRQHALRVIRFFSWAEAHVLAPSGERKEAEWIPRASPSDATDPYLGKLHLYLGLYPNTAASALKGAGNIMKQAGKGYMAFWKLKKKRYADFLASAPQGETRISIHTCYSASDLKDLMNLQVDAARSFINAAKRKKGS